MKTKTKKGFTLVELVIVIAVIAILAAVLIPTFSSLVNKANVSADEQAVRQMNTALAIYTAENGKPESGAEVKTGLSENNINTDTMTPVTKGYAFYWNPSENKIVLVGGSKKAEASWTLLTTNGYGTEHSVSNETDLKEAISASTTDMPALVTLTSDVETKESTKTNNYPIGDKFDVVCHIEAGKSLILDLNKHSLNDKSNACTFAVYPGGTLIIKNGTINSEKTRIINACGGTISLNNVNINIKANETNRYALKIEGLTDLSIVDCEIINDSGFVLTSNSSKNESDGSRMSIVNSTLKSTYKDGAGIYLGTYVNLTIKDSEICGVKHGIYLRGLNATITNSKIYNTGDDGDFAGTGWTGGSGGYSADIVFAAGSGTGYISTGTYVCENVTGTDENFNVIIHEPAGSKVTVTGVKVYKTFTGNDKTEKWS